MTHSSLPAFATTSGPRNAKIVLVGEAFGESEAQLRKPFVGESGKELFRMLGQAWPEVFPDLHARACELHKFGLAWVREREGWLSAAGVLMTNVLALRPPGNKLEALCAKKAEVGGASYDYPPLHKGSYLRPEYLPELSRLHAEILSARPNLVIALGNTACWALLQATNIGSIRGTVSESVLLDVEPNYWVKVLPTYHPAGVMRNWSWRPVVIADLMKALREAEFPDIRRPARVVLVNPSIDELEQWTASTLSSPPPLMAVDIETGAGQVRCIGFARSRSQAIVVPFVDSTAKSGSYWPDHGLEWRAWKCVRELLESPVPKVGQNFVYDLQYLMPLGLRPQACIEDTMLLHHSLFPELQKGLGFLGSIYTSENSWKLMARRKDKTEGVKKE